MLRTALTLGVVITCSALWLRDVAAQSGDPAAAAPAITEQQALQAYDTFRQAPLDNLKEAPVFLKYVQTHGKTHLVYNERNVFWMYRKYDPEVQAVLYAAYTGGNIDSQLRGRQQGDDPAAGLTAALDAYAQLKTRHEDLAIPEFEAFKKARDEGRLPAALATYIDAPAAPAPK